MKKRQKDGKIAVVSWGLLIFALITYLVSWVIAISAQKLSYLYFMTVPWIMVFLILLAAVSSLVAIQKSRLYIIKFLFETTLLIFFILVLVKAYTP